MAEEKDVPEESTPNTTLIYLCIAGAICLPFIGALWGFFTKA